MESFRSKFWWLDCKKNDQNVYQESNFAYILIKILGIQKNIYIYTYLLLSICGIVTIIFLPKNDWNSVIFVVLFFIEIVNGRVTEKLNIFG